MVIDPLHQFMIQKILPLSVGSLDLSLTNCGLFMILSVVLIVGFFAITLRKPHTVPSLFQSMGEIPLAWVRDLGQETNGHHGKSFIPFLASLFFFIFVGNMLGLVPFCFTTTSQLVVNFSLGLLVMALVTIYGCFHLKWTFGRLFVPKEVPWWVLPILTPVEIISYLSRPVSLAVRLFANMVAGHIMLKIFAYFTLSTGLGGILPLGVNVVLIGFELLVSLLQAYVFVMLSSVYLNDALHSH